MSEQKNHNKQTQIWFNDNPNMSVILHNYDYKN